MSGECCRACDGAKVRKRADRENVFRVTTSVCSRCGGTGREPGPPKGDGRGFRRAPKSEDDDNDLNKAADSFLRRHGYGKNGR